MLIYVLIYLWICVFIYALSLCISLCLFSILGGWKMSPSSPDAKIDLLLAALQKYVNADILSQRPI